MLHYSRPSSLTYCFDLRLTAFLRIEERGRVAESRRKIFGKICRAYRGHRGNEVNRRNLVILLVGPTVNKELLWVFLGILSKVKYGTWTHMCSPEDGSISIKTSWSYILIAIQSKI